MYGSKAVVDFSRDFATIFESFPHIEWWGAQCTPSIGQNYHSEGRLLIDRCGLASPATSFEHRAVRRGRNQQMGYQRAA